jgi:hypothetical protein
MLTHHVGQIYTAIYCSMFLRIEYSVFRAIASCVEENLGLVRSADTGWEMAAKIKHAYCVSHRHHARSEYG